MIIRAAVQGKAVKGIGIGGIREGRRTENRQGVNIIININMIIILNEWRGRVANLSGNEVVH